MTPLVANLMRIGAGYALISCRRATPPDGQTLEVTTNAAHLAQAVPPRARAFDLVPQTQGGYVHARSRQPMLTFFTPHITKGSRFDVKDLDVIVKHASFVSQHGEQLPARAGERGLQQHPEQGHSFILTPAKPLEPRVKYELQIVEDDAIRVLAPARFHSTVDGRTVYKLTLFTAAAAVTSNAVRDEVHPFPVADD